MYATYKALDKLHALRSFTIPHYLLYAKFLSTLLYGSELTAFGVNIKRCAVLFRFVRTMLGIKVFTNKSVERS